MKLIRNIIIALASLILSVNVASAGEKWDMALAYGAGNFHSANATEFAKNVSAANVTRIFLINFIFPP